MSDVAFLGLGVMGYPMAGHLSRCGHNVTVYNRTTAKAEQWCRQHRGAIAQSPRAAVAGASLVFLCVGRDSDVWEVMCGDEGVLAGVEPDAVVVDHSTVSASLSREMADLCRAAGCSFVDAPISGGRALGERNAGVIAGQAAKGPASVVASTATTVRQLCGRRASDWLLRQIREIPGPLRQRPAVQNG